MIENWIHIEHPDYVRAFARESYTLRVNKIQVRDKAS